MGDVLGLNYSSINFIFEIYDVAKEWRKYFFENILFCFHLEKEIADAESKTRKKLGI